ncbi:RcnB family protein [Sphingobium aromaticiconvertens]|uniref:RcnB family protein n=1 Tax=Sphingobium aromaticiconvertens TaxID=365341 RepID=UPI003017EADB
MRTRTSLLIGATILIAGLSASAAASAETAGAGGQRASAGRPGPHPGATNANRWGPRQNGRWYAGWRAPGGWNAYRRPVYGYVLPRYWVQPRYYIPNYSAYGFPTPAAGYGWSRYYDDAVMTDRYGRVYDTRSNVDWDRYDGGYADDGDYRDSRRDRRDNGVGGAAIGAVVGGVAGNRIAGRGNRTAGTLIGAGAGAVAGAVIDKAEDGDRRAPPPRRDGYSYGAGRDYAYADDGVTYGGDYQGRWAGTWHGADGTTYTGEYEGEYRGTAHGVTYDAPAYEGRSHWSNQGVPALAAGGYVANGWYYPAPTLTTVTVQPVMQTTTTTSYVTETVRAARPAIRRKVRRCNCK